jgi:hypothetical protein
MGHFKFSWVGAAGPSLSQLAADVSFQMWYLYRFNSGWFSLRKEEFISDWLQTPARLRRPSLWRKMVIARRVHCGATNEDIESRIEREAF